jgi:hypothetical protein
MSPFLLQKKIKYKKIRKEKAKAKNSKFFSKKTTKFRRKRKKTI